MSFVPGTNAVFEIAKTEGNDQTMYNISDALSDSSVDQSVDTEDVTAFGDEAKEYIATLADGTISVSGHFTSTADKVNDVLSTIIRRKVEFAYSPEGKANGSVKMSGKCILTSKSVSAAVGGKVSVSAQFQVSGGVNDGVWSGL